MVSNELEVIKKEKRKLLKTSFKGWFIWHKLIKKYNFRKNKDIAVILMPKDDPENSYFALLYMDRMLKLRNYKSAIVLTRNTIDGKVAPIMCNNLFALEKIEDSDADALLQLYATYMFSPHFFCASLVDPKCRNGADLLGTCGITVEDMVAVGIYKIIPYVRKKRPIYQGSDPDIKKFMLLGGEYKPFRTSVKIR